MTTHPIERPSGSGGGNNSHQGNAKDQEQAIFLDPWLSAKGDPLAALVSDLMPLLQPHHRAPRIRSERRDAIKNRHLCVSNIAANLALLALSPSREPGNLLAVSTAKTRPTRYDREDYPQGILARTIETLEEAGLVVRHPYVFKQKCTTLEPTPAFTDMMERHGVRLRDIGRDAGGETIWLSARTGLARFGNRPPPKCLVHYADTEETTGLRAEVERVNAFLNATGIAFDGERIAPLFMCRSFLIRAESDPEAFNLNGRLWGGFWQTLRTDKRHLITIDGEPIADLDFSSMFAMLAYLRATGSLPGGDPYDIPGLEDHRDGAKLALLSLLSRIGRMKLLSPKLKAALPDGWTAKRLVEAATRRHPTIAHLFGTDLGVELMNTESNILMAALLELEAKGIPALPLHDGIHVRQSDQGAATEAMEAASRRLLGAVLPVVDKPIWRPQRVAEAA